MECGYFLERKTSFIVLLALEMEKLSGLQKQIVVTSKLIDYQDRLGGKKQQNNIKHQLKLFKRFTGLKSMFIIFCLIFYMLGMCIYFFFQVTVTFTWRYGAVMTPTHTKRIQTSFIRSMRCTCAKNDIVCTAKCRCINYGKGKLSLQSVKRRKQGRPLLTTSLSSQTSLKCLLNSEEERERPWITSFQHFILESMLYIT